MWCVWLFHAEKHVLTIDHTQESKRKYIPNPKFSWHHVVHSTTLHTSLKYICLCVGHRQTTIWGCSTTLSWRVTIKLYSFLQRAKISTTRQLSHYYIVITNKLSNFIFCVQSIHSIKCLVDAELHHHHLCWQEELQRQRRSRSQKRRHPRKPPRGRLKRRLKQRNSLKSRVATWAPVFEIFFSYYVKIYDETSWQLYLYRSTK